MRNIAPAIEPIAVRGSAKTARAANAGRKRTVSSWTDSAGEHRGRTSSGTARDNAIAKRTAAYAAAKRPWAKTRSGTGTTRSDSRRSATPSPLHSRIVRSDARSGSTRATESAHTDGADTAIPSAAKSPSAKKAPDAARNAMNDNAVVACPESFESARDATTVCSLMKPSLP